MPASFRFAYHGNSQHICQQREFGQRSWHGEFTFTVVGNLTPKTYYYYLVPARSHGLRLVQWGPLCCGGKRMKSKILLFRKCSNFRSHLELIACKIFVASWLKTRGRNSTTAYCLTIFRVTVRVCVCVCGCVCSCMCVYVRFLSSLFIQGELLTKVVSLTILINWNKYTTQSNKSIGLGMSVKSKRSLNHSPRQWARRFCLHS